MKKNENKQRNNAETALKGTLKKDGRKLTWLSGVTNINYQRLQRIVNQGYDPSISEAAKIAAALGLSITVLFPSKELQQALLPNNLKPHLRPMRRLKGRIPSRFY